MWFAPIIPLSFEANILVLQVQSQHIVTYIEENYLDILSEVLFRNFGPSLHLEYKVLLDSSSGTTSTISSTKTEDIIQVMTEQYSPVLMHKSAADNDFDTQLNPSYTFSTFVAGEANKMARSAASAIAKQPGTTSFNPLFIFGESGVGKTHLANAVGNKIHLTFPNKKVLFVSANTFKIQFQSATKSNNVPGFLKFYQNLDVLIIDDIQYFSRLRGTQDTFFHIFNFLQQTHKQLLFTSDRSPLELKDIDDRLLTRFKWGLTAEIKKPDYELRKNIILSKLKRDGIQLSEEIIEFIARNVNESIRDIEGVIASLLAYSTLSEDDINLALAQQVVSRIVEVKPNIITLEDIIRAVVTYFHVTERELFSKSRNKDILKVRFIAIHLCKTMTNKTLAEIGQALGNRTHATILHALHQIAPLLDNPSWQHDIEQIKLILLN